VDTALRRALKNKPAPEAKRRIEELLEKLDRHALSPETLRSIRAVEALEHLGTPAARECSRVGARRAGGTPDTRGERVGATPGGAVKVMRTLARETVGSGNGQDGH